MPDETTTPEAPAAPAAPAAEASPPTYPVGAAKQNPETHAVAVRCNDGLPDEWAVMTVDNGGHYASWSEVSEWKDLHHTQATQSKAKKGS